MAYLGRIARQISKIPKKLLKINQLRIFPIQAMSIIKAKPGASPPRHAPSAHTRTRDAAGARADSVPPAQQTLAAPPQGPSPTQTVQHLTVDAELAGQRLDNFLLRHLRGVPKTHVYRIIRSGEVRVNRARSRADARVQAGDLIRIPPLRMTAPVTADGPDAQSGTHAVPPRDFALLLEDTHFIALNKPAGVAVHGGSGVSFGVIEQLRRARPSLPFLELVHRLDRETSGVLLVAKKRSALLNLQDQFRARATGKTYLALVCGRWNEGQRVIDVPLRKYLVANGSAQGERRVRPTTADDPEGMRAITLINVRTRIPARPDLGLPELTLLEVTIKTGRTHQIRVHLASSGCPIAGDEKYGDFALNRQFARHGLKRMYLHAWRLRIQHPATGEPLTLHAALPPSLSAFVPEAGTSTPSP